MLKIPFYISGSLVLGTLFGGCTVPENKPTVVVVPSPAPTPPIIVTPAPPIVANPGLIQSTNPNERLKQVKVTNKDPFSANQPTALFVTAAPSNESGTAKPGTVREPSSDVTPVSEGSSDASGGQKSKSKGRVVRAKSQDGARPGKVSDKAEAGKNNASGTTKNTDKSNSNKNNSATKAIAKSNRGTKATSARPGKLSRPGKVSSSSQGKKSSSGTRGSGNSSGSNNSKNPTINPSNGSTRPSVPVIPDDGNTPPIAVNPTVSPGGDSGAPSTPDIPQPQIASQVEVRGVVQLDNGYSYAIVRGPNEKSSTNLAQGDLIPNTGITVKRIEVDRAEGKLSGMVILEENGIEVSRPVGQKVGGASDETGASQGGGSSFPNNEGASPASEESGNPSTQQQFNSPATQPVSNPPTSGTPTTQPNQPVSNPPTSGTPINQPVSTPSGSVVSPATQPPSNPPGFISPTPIPLPESSPSPTTPNFLNEPQ